MKKKKIATTLLAATMVFGTVPNAFAADQITVTVNGEKVVFADQNPVNINGRVMVPIRDVAEKMGWEVEWFTYYGNTIVDGQFQQEHDIILRKPVEKTDRFSAGYQSNINIERQTRMSSIDGATPHQTDEIPVTAPLKVINGRTLFGIRDIAECTYSNVEWDGATQTVKITTKPVEQFPNHSDVLKHIEEYKKVMAESQKPQETKPVLTLEEEERQMMEKYAKEQNSKRDEFAEDVIALINKEREKEGLAKLQVNDTLMEAAKVRVKEITTDFSHTRPDGRKAKTAANEAGFSGDYIGENIAGSANTPELAVTIWGESEGHRKNYLKPEYTQTGVAYLYDKDSKYGSYWVQIFAK